MTRRLPTVADLRGDKGKVQKTMLRYFSLDEAAAAEAAAAAKASAEGADGGGRPPRAAAPPAAPAEAEGTSPPLLSPISGKVPPPSRLLLS